MKRFFTFSFFLVAFNSLFGQTITTDSLNQRIDSLRLEVVKTRTLIQAPNDTNLEKIQYKIKQEVQQAKANSFVLTNTSLNKFFVKRVASYLTGSSDLSFYNNVAAVNTESDRLQITQNIVLPKRAIESFYITHILSISVETDVEDGFSTLFKNDQWSYGAGLGLKYTYIGSGKLRYNNGVQKRPVGNKIYLDKDSHFEYMDDRRKTIKGEVFEKLRREWNVFLEGLSEITDETLRKELIDNKIKELKKKYLGDFTDKELEYLEGEKTKFNVARIHWWSLGTYLPIESKYWVAEDVNSFPVNRYGWPFEFYGKGSLLKEHFSHRVLLTGTIKIAGSNTILSEEVSKYKLRSTVNGIDTLDDKTIYVGEFRNFLAPSIRGQLVYFNKYWDYLGLDLFFEEKISEFPTSNWGIGIPVQLKGKDDETNANFELLFKRAKMGTSEVDWIIGINAAIPFGSIVYK